MHLIHLILLLSFIPLAYAQSTPPEILPEAKGELTIEIVGGREEEGGQPIAIAPFGGMAHPPQDLAGIISNNLARTGRFSPTPSYLLPERPTQSSAVNFASWQSAGIPHLVVGQVEGSSAGGYQISFKLLDTYQGGQILGLSYQATLQTLRQVAHRISDEIYRALTGQRGAFSTQIVYVTIEKRGRDKIYVLNVADADGANPRTMLRSVEPILSPSWSPNGKRIAYVTYDVVIAPQGYRDKQMAIYTQDVQTGYRERVSIGRGLNAAPAWSPDGSRMALTLSKDGNAEVYIMNLSSRALTRLTYDPAIDTEPTWSPDGQSIAFTSDRSGTPQIYRVSVNGGTPQRITFKGNYNARARFSPDGQKLALLHNGEEGGYKIATYELNNNDMRVLSRSSFDDSPSFAPNGDMIIYGTGTELSAISSDGRMQQRLGVEMGEVREPSWSPFSE